MSLKKPNPFIRIFDFAYQRSTPQAWGFYFAHLGLYLILSGVIMGFMMAAGLTPPIPDGSVDPATIDTAAQTKALLEQQVQSARLVGPLLGLTHALTLTILVLKKKGLDKHMKTVAWGALAVLLGGLGGPIASLIVIAWLTTKASERPIELH